MRRVIIAVTMATLVGGVASLATAGTADGQGAQKAGLYPTTTSDSQQCDPGTAGTSQGFAILNGAGKIGALNKVNGEVSLKKATANHTYTVWLADDTANTCVMAATLVTNGVGNGNAHINQPDLQASTYYVVLKDGANEVFASSPVPIK
jgi:hypothetical protein